MERSNCGEVLEFFLSEKYSSFDDAPANLRIFDHPAWGSTYWLNCSKVDNQVFWREDQTVAKFWSSLKEKNSFVWWRSCKFEDLWLSCKRILNLCISARFPIVRRSFLEKKFLTLNVFNSGSSLKLNFFLEENTFVWCWCYRFENFQL